ncbi:MAG: HNH endonuclease, partial [Bifidobacteriaceae bacterium]|jgi:hypothetical protein|nr:HNH endonuclease [Bifidobacteriaceae bacterium]
VAVLRGAAGELGRRVGPDRAALGADPAVLDQITGLAETGNALGAAVDQLVGAADRSGVASQATTTGLTTWLMVKHHLTRAQATRMVLRARGCDRFAKIRSAALAGAVNPWQVEAATDVLRHLPGDLGSAQTAQAEEAVVGLAGEYASDALARAGEEILERVAPQIAQEQAEAKAGRQLRRAEAKQFFAVRDNHDGTSSLMGLLPAAEAERVRAVIDKAADKARREQVGAPDGRPMDRGRARALALVEVCAHAQGCSRAQPLGAACARLAITVRAEDLDNPSAAAVIAASGRRLDQTTFSRLACDCEAMRVVLGAKGEVLDVGRATRVIPKGLRAAVVARDKGCAFPGCDRSPEVCEGHHVRPWRRGGATNLSNICLLCPTHHKLVEPPVNGPPGWEPSLRDDGLWEFIPPPWFDPDRKPLLHHRFRT